LHYFAINKIEFGSGVNAAIRRSIDFVIVPNGSDHFVRIFNFYIFRFSWLAKLGNDLSFIIFINRIYKSLFFVGITVLKGCVLASSAKAADDNVDASKTAIDQVFIEISNV
jgi:hypothetical protein